MKEICSGSLVVQKSRFYVHLYDIRSEAGIEDILKDHRRMYKRAVHHCWACRLEASGGFVERCKDDGEVGRPGKVLLEVMRRRDAAGLLVVSRIFGGVKLGVGGVSRAFRDAAERTLDRHT